MTELILPDGWWYPDDIKYYREIYSLLPDNATTLEIGCWKGRSICSISDIIIQKNINVYVVDNFLGSENEQETFHKEAKTVDIEAVFHENLEKFNLTSKVKIWKVDTRKIWEVYPTPDNFFDFIFIDGQHTADMVEHDIRICLPKLKIGSLLAGHDLVLNEVKSGVENVFGEDYSVKTDTKNIWEIKKELETKGNKMDENKIILISCWSKPLRSGGFNAKNPSKEWWTKVVKLLKDKGYGVWQTLQGPEIKIKFIDRYLADMDLWALGTQIQNCATWISPDNFMHHWALQFKKPGVVIWSQSDPEIFGHKENVNLLKNPKYLREKQFAMWEDATYNSEAFVEPNTVVEAVEKLINDTNKKVGNQ